MTAWLFLSEVMDLIRPPVPACNLRLCEANSLMSPISFHHGHHAPLKPHNEIAPGFVFTPKISFTLLNSTLTFLCVCVSVCYCERSEMYTSGTFGHPATGCTNILRHARPWSHVTSIWNCSGNVTMFWGFALTFPFIDFKGTCCPERLTSEADANQCRDSLKEPTAI